MRFHIALLCAGFLGGCVSTPTIESMVAEGGQVVSGGIGSLIGDEGVTLSAVDGTWVSYLAPNGEKKLFIKPKNVKETLSWRRDTDGTYCEMMYKPRKEQCHSDTIVLVKSSNDVYSNFFEGKKGKYPFKVFSGNTEGL